MKRFFFLATAVLGGLLAPAQQTLPTNNLLLGYQEFPTVITGHAADGSGSQYYTGYFRGQLTVNNQAVTAGSGLEDIFWVKTNSAGQLLKYKTFGSPNSEGSYVNALAMGSNNRMVFGLNTFETLALGTTTLVPYLSPSGTGFASGLVCTDTAGNVLWSKKTNLQNFRIYYANNVYHIFGSVLPVSPATKYGDVTVLDSLGKSAFVHLMIDENGNFLGAKSIATRRSGQGIRLYNVSFFSDNSLFVQLRLDADSSFQVNNSTVSLPNNFGSYHVFLRTDTSYTVFKSKTLNPLGHSIAAISGGQWMPACVGPNDSVYTVLTYENTITAPFSIDGFPQAPLLNTLFVMDPSLTVRRQVFLSSSSAGSYALSQYKRRVYFRNMLFQNGRLFLNGVFTGINESPVNAIPPKDTTIRILPGVTTTVDQNGPSKSFVASCDINGLSGTMNWYGSHSEYENVSIAPAFLHPAGPLRVGFIQTNDNVWNPWTVDENLTVITGSMRKGVDMPETPQMVQYFADGSRVVLGYASGKTAFDASNTFVTNAGRRDVFMVRLRPNNQVVWYKRFYSTLTSPGIRGLEIRNGKAYFLINYLGSQNDSNYIKVENNLYNVRPNASLLASIDTAGNLSVLNLANSLLRPSMLMSFSFFSNGDLAVATDVNPVAYASFPLSFAPQIFRLNPSTGAIIEGRKFFGFSTIGITTLQIDKNDRLYLSGTTNYSFSSYKIYLHNGSNTIDSLLVPANSQPQPTVLAMDWNHFQWLKRISGNFFIRQTGELTLVQDRPVLSILSPAVSQPLFWDGQTIHNGFTAQSLSLVKLNPDGSIAVKKSIANFSINYMRSGANNALYVTGLIRSPLQVDTIQVGYAGGMVDGLALAFDSNLVAKKSFRVGSPYSESMLDMDIYQDSVAALAYTGQTAPQVYFNRTSVSSSDYLEDAYVGTVSARNNVVTGIGNPVPAGTFISITPNPVAGNVLWLSITATEPLLSNCTVYAANGQIVCTSVLKLSRGSGRYAAVLPVSLGKGVYRAVIANKKWTVARAFLVQ